MTVESGDRWQSDRLATTYLVLPVEMTRKMPHYSSPEDAAADLLPGDYHLVQIVGRREVS